jgi:hypothetical protein
MAAPGGKTHRGRAAIMPGPAFRFLIGPLRPGPDHYRPAPGLFTVIFIGRFSIPGGKRIPPGLRSFTVFFGIINAGIIRRGRITLFKIQQFLALRNFRSSNSSFHCHYLNHLLDYIFPKRQIGKG